MLAYIVEPSNFLVFAHSKEKGFFAKRMRDKVACLFKFFHSGADVPDFSPQLCPFTIRVFGGTETAGLDARLPEIRQRTIGVNAGGKIA